MSGIHQWHVPSSIVFGAGAADELGTHADECDISTALIVTDPGIRSAGLLESPLTSLERSGIDHAVFDGVEPDPTDEVVHEAARHYAEANADGVIAIGGGSTIDTTKGTTILATNSGNVLDFEGYGNVSNPTPPSIYVPTTAGTGSEVSHWCLITDSETHIKEEVGDTELLADVAIIDPMLASEAPAAVRAASGMDALTHAIESLWSVNAMPYTSALASDAVRAIAPALPRVVESREPDGDIITAMARASMQAGIAFNGAGNAGVHALSHQVGGMFSVPHGVANAILLPYVMEYNLPVVDNLLTGIAESLGESVDRHGPNREAYKSVRAVCDLRLHVGIPHTLAETEVTRDTIPELADQALDDGCLSNNPRRTSLADLEAILERAFDGELRYETLLD